MTRFVVIFPTTVLSTVVAAADDSRAIAKLLSDINAPVREDKRRMLRVHSTRHLLARRSCPRRRKTRDSLAESVPGYLVMRTTASVFVLVALLLSALVASSIAIEPDKPFEFTSGWSKDKSTAAAAADDSKAVAKLINDINAVAKTNRSRILSIIIINTNVAGPTLEQQASRNGLSLGEVYVAHSLALASRKSFAQIMASKAAGNSWAKIARTNKVSLRGSTAALKEMMRSKRDD